MLWEGKAVCIHASTHHSEEQLNTQAYDPKSCMQSAQGMGIMLDKLHYELLQWMPLQELKASGSPATPTVPKAEFRASNSRQKIVCKSYELVDICWETPTLRREPLNT